VSSTLWTAVFTGAQFRCDATVNIDGIDRAVGTSRLWTSASMDAKFPKVNPGDFVRPKVEQLDVTAYPDTGEVVAVLRATDEDTGRSGIDELILAVFNPPTAAEGAIPAGEGFVETYSVQRAVSATDKGLDGLAVTITAAGAYGKRLAVWATDGAGNANYKSLKGQLFQAIPVNILQIIASGLGAGDPLRILIGGFDCLSLPTLTIDYSDGRPSEFYDLTAYLTAHPEAIEYVTEGEDCNDAIITIPQDFGVLGEEGITVTATVRAGGGIGSDSLTIYACLDPEGDSTLAGADIIGCGFSKSGTTVTITATMFGTIDPNVQYRLELPEFGALFKLWECTTTPANCKKSSAPTGVTLKKNGVVSNDGKTITFQVDLAPLGWNGVTPLLFKLSTQGGIPGSPNEGFPDETQVFTG